MRQSDHMKESGNVEGTVPSQWYLDMKAERDALLGDIRMIAETTPHKQGCDEPDDSLCARCVADSALARAEVGE